MPKRLITKPTTNWKQVSILDGVQITDARCELCNHRIRWIHVLEHDDYFTSIQVGSCCAMRLCNDYDAAEVERIYKLKQSRRMNFLKSWKPSKTKPSNIWRKVRTTMGEVTVTVFEVHPIERFGVFVAGKKGFKHCPPQRYQSKHAALDAAFELIEVFNDRAS